MGSDADAIELRVGEEHSVALAGLGTAGYRWVPNLEGDVETADVRPGNAEADDDGAAVGSSVDEVFTIHAKQPGTVRIRFEQRRPWENDTPPADEHTIQLRVE